MTTPKTPTLGEVFFLRREALGLSQVELAWLARMSRNTISNLERGKGASQNTIRNVALTLGGNFWDFLSWESRAEAQASDEVYDHAPMDPTGSWLVDEDQVAAVLRATIGARVKRPRSARTMADQWMVYNAALSDLTLSLPPERAAEERDESFRLLRTELSLGDFAHNEEVIAWLEDNGWTPEDDLPTAHQELEHQLIQQEVERFSDPHSNMGLPSTPAEVHAMVEQMKKIEEKHAVTGRDKEKADAFSRLPIMVQHALMNSDVGNAAVETPQGSAGVTHVFLTLIDEEVPRFDQRRALASLSNALCATRIALDLTYKFDGRTPTLDEVVTTARVAMDTYGVGLRSSDGSLQTDGPSRP